MLIWSGPGGRGGATVAQLAEKLGLAGQDGSGAFYVPATPNGRGVADAWAAASDDEGGDMDSVGLLIVSGDEAAGDPNVRALAERAEAVIAISMFHGLAVGWADLVLPGTSYLEREGTYVNLEGRLQRLRPTALPPAPDELEWIAKLAARFDVQLAPYAPRRLRRGVGALLRRAAVRRGRRARAAPRLRGRADARRPAAAAGAARSGQGLKLVCYKPLFSGPAVERVSELQFQRPQAEVELSEADAKQRGVTTGDDVTLTGGGATVTVQARVNRKLREGIARMPREFAGEVRGTVDVARAGVPA